jgi:CBS-domain-containing membrane protein
LAGLVRLAALRPVLAQEQVWGTLIAADVAEPAPVALTPGMDLKTALAAMEAHGFREMLVVEDGGREFVGLLTRERAEQAVQEALLERAGGAAGGGGLPA